MPRNVSWRRTFSDFTCASQAFAVNSTMYILRQTGPTGFLLQEEGESKNFKVFLGDPHSCTCPTFRKEKDLCKHICWILLKKFRLDRDNPLSWQMGLSDLELDEVMRGPVVVRRNQQRQTQVVPRQVADASAGRTLVAQRDIADDDVCPICQDEFMDKKLPVTYCKFSCGNNVHIKCMKVWAEHQIKSSADKIIKCPMCREDFGPITLLKEEMRNANAQGNSTATPEAPSNPNRMDRHVGIGCSNCRMAPVEGKCYRCSTCADFYLCQACFNTPAHTHHGFQFRHKRNQRWRAAQRMLGAALPDALVNDLMNRDISEADYDTLLQLDNTAGTRAPLSDLTEETVQLLPVEKVRERGALLAPGSQCRLCLRPFTPGQYVRKLPCHHKFHKDCIDSWLLHSHSTCPVDNTPVFTNRPRSDINSFNRHSSISDTSQATHQSQSNQRDSRSNSVPALGISAIRLGGEGDGPVAGDRGVLARRPPRPVNVPHRPPIRLELTGTRVGAEDANANSRSERLESDMLPPGSQLLQQAIHRRTQLNEHLTRLMLEAATDRDQENTHPHAYDQIHPQHHSMLEMSQDHHLHHSHHVQEHSPLGQMHARNHSPQHARDLSPLMSEPGPDARSLFDFDSGFLGREQSTSAGGGFLPGRVRSRGQTSAVRARVPLRQRSNSQGRLQPRGFQDLFLGNDPRSNPPPEGEVPIPTHMAAGSSRHGLMHRPSNSTRKTIGRTRGPNITLEGNSVLDHLTLRDIL